jgi:hypothetical protein
MKVMDDERGSFFAQFLLINRKDGRDWPATGGDADTIFGTTVTLSERQTLDAAWPYLVLFRCVIVRGIVSVNRERNWRCHSTLV